MNLSQSSTNPSLRVLRQFSALCILFFGLLAVRLALHDRYVAASFFAAFAVIVGPLGVVKPSAVRPIYVTWMKLVHPIGWVVSRVTMAVIFYGLFAPIGLVFRVTGRDALGLKRPQGKETHWQTKATANNSEQYSHQY
jgi:hypothetical protein